MKINYDHTAAPWTTGDHVWHTDEATGMGFRFRQIEFSGGCLAWVADDEGDEEGPANAALIAAAPELFRALADIAVNIQNGGCPVPGSVMHERAMAALEKAMGIVEAV